MKLESQLVNLELSQEIDKLEKKLGVEQEALFYYELYSTGFSIRREGEGVMNHDDFSGSEWHKNEHCIPAYTTAELGEKLNKYINFISGKGLDSPLEFYCTQISLPEFEIWTERFVEADTEANSRAKCLIYLMENGIIK